MKHCHEFSLANHCFKVHRLAWEEAAEQLELQADAKPDLPFVFAMCDEAADNVKNKGKKTIYDELCRIQTVGNIETANWIRDFTDQLVQKLDRSAFDQKTGQWKESLAGSAQRWEALKKLISQRSDLDNLIKLVQEATDFKIHYGRGILAVNFEMPRGPQEYHVIVNENLASQFIGDTDWFKAWLRDRQLDREKMNEEEVRRAEEKFLNESGQSLFDRIATYADSMSIPWNSTKTVEDVATLNDVYRQVSDAMNEEPEE